MYKNKAKKVHYTLADHITSHAMRRTGITTLLMLGVPMLAASSEAIVVNIGASGALGGFVGGNIQMVLLYKGNDKGLYFYRTFDMNLGFGASVGASIGFVDYNEKSSVPLDRTLFEGDGQGWSVGDLQYSASYKEGMIAPWQNGTPTSQGILVPIKPLSGGPPGAWYTWTKSSIIPSWSIKFPTSKGQNTKKEKNRSTDKSNKQKKNKKRDTRPTKAKF